MPHDPAVFVAACVRFDPRGALPNADLCAAWRAWAGTDHAAHRAVSRAMLAAGFEQSNNRAHGRVWRAVLVDAGAPPRETAVGALRRQIKALRPGVSEETVRGLLDAVDRAVASVVAEARAVPLQVVK